MWRGPDEARARSVTVRGMRSEFSRAAVLPPSAASEGRCGRWFGGRNVLWGCLWVATGVMAMGSVALYGRAFSSSSSSSTDVTTQRDDVHERDALPAASGAAAPARSPAAQSDGGSLIGSDEFYVSSDAWEIAEGSDGAERTTDGAPLGVTSDRGDPAGVEGTDAIFSDPAESDALGEFHVVTKMEPLLFIHIPKNAGGSIELACACEDDEGGLPGCRKLPHFDLVARAVRTEGLELPGNWPAEVEPSQRLCKSYAHMFPQYDARQLQATRDHPTFCVVRHPLTRAVSEYEFKHRHDPASANSVEDMNRQLQNAARYRIEYGECSPENPRSCNADCHWASQHLYLWDKTSGAPTCDHVLFYENLDDEFSGLMEAYGLSARCTLHAKGEDDNVKGSHTYTGSHLGVEDLEDETYLLLLEAYADDMAILGYSPNDPHAAPDSRPPHDMPLEHLRHGASQ